MAQPHWNRGVTEPQYSVVNCSLLTRRVGDIIQFTKCAHCPLSFEFHHFIHLAQYVDIKYHIAQLKFGLGLVSI